MKTDQEVNQKIKEAYKIMLDTVKLNEPEVYMMSQELFNELMKKIAYLDDALKDARKTNERLTEIKREDNRKIVENLESKRKYWQDKFNKLKEETSHAN